MLFKPPLTSMYNVYPSHRTLRKMGLLADQEGIFKRYINEEGEWNHHLNYSKNFIIESVKDTHSKSIAVMGSGWLLDVPVAFLAENFEKVYLYDLKHPQEIKHKYRKQTNFKFIEMDLTGGIINQVFNLYQGNRKKSSFQAYENLLIPEISLPFPADFIVSLNVLSQVDSLLVDYMKRRTEIPADLETSLRREIQSKHTQLLEQGNSCLITDYEEIALDSQLNVIKSDPLIYADIPPGVVHKEWIWHFDTRMTYHPDQITYFKVKAVKL